MKPENENDAYVHLICGQLQIFIRRLKRIPSENWDYAFTPSCPTPRLIAEHVLHWLICDRQHITEPDATRHALIPPSPTSQQDMCEALLEEYSNWKTMLRELTNKMLGQELKQFNRMAMNARSFVCHMVNNVIYKNGQLATIYFALGLDGEEPFTSPLPNKYYKMTRKKG